MGGRSQYIGANLRQIVQFTRRKKDEVEQTLGKSKVCMKKKGKDTFEYQSRNVPLNHDQ